MIYELKDAVKWTQYNNKNLLSVVTDTTEIFAVPYATKVSSEIFKYVFQFMIKQHFHRKILVIKIFHYWINKNHCIQVKKQVIAIKFKVIIIETKKHFIVSSFNYPSNSNCWSTKLAVKIHEDRYLEKLNNKILLSHEIQ